MGIRAKQFARVPTLNLIDQHLAIDHAQAVFLIFLNWALYFLSFIG